MNLLIVFPEERRGHQQWELIGHRAARALSLHELSSGATTLFGECGGSFGQGKIVEAGKDRVVIEGVLTDVPPPRAPVSFVVGVPRPQAIKRILQYVAMVGASSLIFVGSARGQKSYLQTPVLSSNGRLEYLLRGAEQAVDTRLPSVEVVPSFREFERAVLPQIADRNRGRLVLLDTGEARPLQDCLGSAESGEGSGHTVLAIGSERGWESSECDTFIRHGFERASLGSRVLRVEVALLMGFTLAALAGTARE